MNFKDEYRAANEQIHGDRTILAGITEKPKKIIYFKPAVGICAAAAVCVAVLLLYPYINLPSGEKEAPVKTDNVFLASEQEQGMPIPEITEDEQPPAVMMRKMAPENVTEPTSEPEKNVKTHSYTEKNAAVETENTAENTAEMFFTADVTEEAVSDNTEEAATEDFATDAAVNMPMAEETLPQASAGGGGSASAVKQKYIFSEDFSAVVFCDGKGNEIRYEITPETMFVNETDQTVKPEEIKVIVAVEIQDGILLKVKGA